MVFFALEYIGLFSRIKDVIWEKPVIWVIVSLGISIRIKPLWLNSAQTKIIAHQIASIRCVAL
jgi:hypothetical protein